MFTSPKHFFFASALLLAALPVLGAEGSSGLAPVATPTAVVKCPGITSIPFTADEEQALPLQVVGTLRCGETVSILSDTEGYTAHVRTPDGQEGYVARMYLANEAAPAAPAPKAQPSVATPTNGVVRWVAGAPGCDQFISHGRYVESITANGITVQVSLQDSGWKYRVNVAISNQSGESVHVMPGIITLDELEPKLKSLLTTDPAKITRNPNHQALWTFADAVPTTSAAGSRHARTSQADPLADRTSPTPDYLSPHMTLASARPAAFQRVEPVDILAISLKSVDLPSGQTTAGVMWYDRDAIAREFSLRVPAGDLVFDFAFSLEQKK